MFHHPCNRRPACTYWDERIKACAIWRAAPSLRSPWRKTEITVQWNIISFNLHSHKERQEATSKAVIRVSSREERKELLFIATSQTFWCDLQLKLWCLIRKAKLGLSLEHGRSFFSPHSRKEPNLLKSRCGRSAGWHRSATGFTLLYKVTQPMNQCWISAEVGYMLSLLMG